MSGDRQQENRPFTEKPILPLTPTARIWATLRRAVGAALIVRENLNLWEWSDRHITLDSRFSARPGKYDSAYTFYIRGPMEALSDRRIRQVSIVKGAQIAFTTMLANWIMYLVDMDPGPTMLAQPTRRMMKRYVKKELHDRFLKTPRLSAYIPANRREKFTTEEMYFTSMDLFATGVGSPALVSSLPIKNVAADEVDKWNTETEIEASALDLIEVRQITYKAQGTSKFVVGSTPTVPEMPISIEAAKGSQERFFVPCPECGHMQELKFEHLAWSHIKKVRHKDGSYNLDLVEKHTAYECQNPDCGAKIPHEKKQWMMRRGEWRAQNPNAPADHRSFYIGGELSTALTWGMLAKKFLETQHLPGGLHNFYNSYLGRAWERKTGGATRKAIQLIQEASPKFNLWQPQDPAAQLVLPFRPIAITMQVDVQQLEFYYTLRAWMVDGTRATIALGSCVSYKELVDISNRKWLFDHGPVVAGVSPAARYEEFDVWTGLMDSGYKSKATTGVYNFAYEQGGRWIVTKGGKYAGGRDLPISETTILHNVEAGQVEIALIHYTDEHMKEWLYRFVIKERRQPALWLPQDLPPDYIEQLTAERLVPKRNAEGRTELKWTANGIDPHFGDCEKIGEIFNFLLPADLRQKIRDKQDADRAALLEKLKAA
jgi:phage terminase large subunit GpA-like protein